MSNAAVAAVPPVGQSVSQSIKAGQVLVIGRLLSIRKAGQLFEHLIVLPAPDQYSSPSTVAVLAKQRLGDKESDVRVLCRLGGFRRSFKSTDQDTGEVRQVQTADNKLFAVEE